MLRTSNVSIMVCGFFTLNQGSRGPWKFLNLFFVFKGSETLEFRLRSLNASESKVKFFFVPVLKLQISSTNRARVYQVS